LVFQDVESIIREEAKLPDNRLNLWEINMKKASFYLFTLGLSVLLMGLMSCGGAKEVSGTYEVTGSAGVVANITYAPSGLGSNSTAVSQTLPWQSQFTGYETEGSYQGSYVFLSAVNDAPAASSSSITITILEDNQVYQQPNYTIGGGNPVTLFGYF
jgi:hypothetical protein